MKHLINDLDRNMHRLDRRTIQLMILVITLLLFVLVGGAPDGGGSTCIPC